MEVRVKIATILKDKTKPPIDRVDFSMQLEDGDRAGNVIEELGLPDKLAGIVLVNKRRSSRERVLEEGDQVVILPRITGG